MQIASGSKKSSRPSCERGELGRYVKPRTEILKWHEWCNEKQFSISCMNEPTTNGLFTETYFEDRQGQTSRLDQKSFWFCYSWPWKVYQCT